MDRPHIKGIQHLCKVRSFIGSTTVSELLSYIKFLEDKIETPPNEKGDIYNMILHSTCNVGEGIKVLRVNKGWIYQFKNVSPTNQFFYTTEFIPYDGII